MFLIYPHLNQHEMTILAHGVRYAKKQALEPGQTNKDVQALDRLISLVEEKQIVNLLIK